ncbi:MAG: sugar phosphate isomerase/epimerase [Kiritimatiellae bacterium]|nr:sugar phosphate isomerase/epimerase [Kiritimatiellia bacterium]
MRISMWSSWFIDLSPEEMVKAFAGEGWAHTELSSEHGWALLDRGDPAEAGAAFRRFAGDEGLSVPQGHFYLAVDIVQPDATERAKMMDDMKRWCDLFMALGITDGVLHPGGAAARDAGWDADRILAANVEALQALLRFLAGGPTRICLENGGSGMARLAPLLDAIPNDALRVCLDTGHLNLGQAGTSAEFVRQAGKKLTALHIADNRGERDDHTFPRGPQCTADWTGFVDALREVGYDGLWNYEVPGESSCRIPGQERRQPMAIRRAKLRYARELAEAMLDSFPAGPEKTGE